MPKLMKNKSLYAKVEATKGVVNPPVGADYVRVTDPTTSLEGNRNITRENVATHSQGSEKPAHGGTLRMMEMGWEVAAGTNSSPIPEHSALYEAVGFALDNTTDADEARFSLQSNENIMKTATFDLNQDGTRTRMFAACANAFSLEAVTGETLMCNATFVGKDGGQVDEAPPTKVESTTEPLVVTGVTLSVGGSSVFVVESVSIDLGLDTQMPPDMQQSDGYTIPRRANRAVVVTINPEKENLSVRDWFAALTAKTNIPISLEIGTSFGTNASGNGRIRVSLPNCAVTELSDGDRGGIITDEVTLQAYKSAAGNDELSFIFD